MIELIQYEFVNRERPMLRVTLKGNDNSFAVSNLQLRMIQRSSNHGILAIRLEEVNDETGFYVNLQGKRPLSVELRNKRITAEQATKFMMRLLDIIVGASDLFLNPERFLLDPEILFVGDGFQDLYCVYLPVTQNNVAQADLRIRVREIYLFVLGHVERWEGTILPGILHKLGDSECSLAELKQQVEGWLQSGGTNEVLVDRGTHTDSNRDNRVAGEASFDSDLQSGGTGQKGQNEDEALNALNWWSEDTGMLSDEEQPERFVRSNQAGSNLVRFWLCLVGSVALHAALWALYRTNPSEGLLYLNIGIGLLAADACYLAFHLRGSSTMPWKYRLAVAGISSEEYHEAAGDGEGERNLAVFSEAQHTTILDESPPTVLLGRTEGGSRGELILSTVQAGKEHRYPIEDSAVIGRDAQRCEIVDRSEGISRAHAEIRKGELQGDFEARDLGSRNGSGLNGEAMIAFRWYPLRPGDELRLADQCYRAESANARTAAGRCLQT